MAALRRIYDRWGDPRPWSALAAVLIANLGYGYLTIPPVIHTCAPRSVWRGIPPHWWGAGCMIAATLMVVGVVMRDPRPAVAGHILAGMIYAGAVCALVIAAAWQDGSTIGTGAYTWALLAQVVIAVAWTHPPRTLRSRRETR